MSPRSSLLGGARLELRRASITYRQSGFRLSPVALSVRPGQVVALIGPNASGKSTVLKLASGSIRSESGTVLLDSQPVAGLGAIGIEGQGGLVRNKEASIGRQAGHRGILQITVGHLQQSPNLPLACVTAPEPSLRQQVFQVHLRPLSGRSWARAGFPPGRSSLAALWPGIPPASYRRC